MFRLFKFYRIVNGNLKGRDEKKTHNRDHKIFMQKEFYFLLILWVGIWNR